MMNLDKRGRRLSGKMSWRQNGSAGTGEVSEQLHLIESFQPGKTA